MNKPIKIIFSNQKGGVGKTTLCRNLGYYLASIGFKVLLLDLDPQGNLTKSFIPDRRIGLGTFEALSEGVSEPVKVCDGLDLMPAERNLAVLEKQLVGELDANTRLRRLFEDEWLFKDYQVVFIDSPPSLGLLTVNGLCASDYLVIPMNPAIYSMQGCNDLLDTAGKVKQSLNPDLEVLGFVINAFNPAPVIFRQIREEIKKSFGDRVFDTEVSKSVKIEESIALGRGVTAMAGPGTRKVVGEVKALGEELLGRLGLKIPTGGTVHEPGQA